MQPLLFTWTHKSYAQYGAVAQVRAGWINHHSRGWEEESDGSGCGLELFF